MSLLLAITTGGPLLASQSADSQGPEGQVHEHTGSGAVAPATWTLDVDGALFATFNHQGGTRGETEFRSQNWLMLMGARRVGSTRLTLSAMFTAEPLTVGSAGYSEI